MTLTRSLDGRLFIEQFFKGVRTNTEDSADICKLDWVRRWKRGAELLRKKGAGGECASYSRICKSIGDWFRSSCDMISRSTILWFFVRTGTDGVSYVILLHAFLGFRFICPRTQTKYFPRVLGWIGKGFSQFPDLSGNCHHNITSFIFFFEKDVQLYIEQIFCGKSVETLVLSLVMRLAMKFFQVLYRV